MTKPAIHLVETDAQRTEHRFISAITDSDGSLKMAAIEAERLANEFKYTNDQIGKLVDRSEKWIRSLRTWLRNGCTGTLFDHVNQPKNSATSPKDSLKTNENSQPGQSVITAEQRKAEYADDDDPEAFLTDEGDYAPVSSKADEACRIRGFLYRAQQSTFAASADDLKNIRCTKEMLKAAREVVEEWTKTLNKLENYHENKN